MEKPRPKSVRLEARVKPDTRSRFFQFLIAHQLDGDGGADKGLELLLDMTENPPIGELTLSGLLSNLPCTDDERTTIREVITQSEVSWQSFIKDALLRKTERLSKREDKLADIDLTDPVARSKVKGAAYALVDKVVHDLMHANTQASDMAQKRYISKGMVERLSGVAQITVRGYWRDHGATITAHNTAMGFRDALHGKQHNQWVYKGEDTLANVAG